MKISHELLFFEKQRVQVDDRDIQFMNENVTRHFMWVCAHRNKRTEVKRPCIQEGLYAREPCPSKSHSGSFLDEISDLFTFPYPFLFMLYMTSHAEI